MEHNLSESNLALERFAYSASHDLQEPLRKISSFSGALERRLGESNKDPEVTFQLERICDASVRMGKMIDNLLKLSRATSVPLNIQSVSLSSIIIQALDDLSSKIKKIDMKVILKRDVFLSVDAGAFGQVIRNLISNSVAYKDSNRFLTIIIDTKEYEKQMSIKYQDNGLGFSADKAEIIFEPFRRLVSKDIPGSGMGLTICRQVLKAHKGRIYASPIEQGAMFILELPKEQLNGK
jgi:light-regulated signal transduction histidine kinase (bacteriophytochrome)